MRSVGLDAVTFATAEEFLQSTELPSPTCLILDVHLPGMSGLELQKQLGAERRSTPIIFITAYTEDQARDLALRSGAIAWLQKPFEEKSLIDAIHRAGC